MSRANQNGHVTRPQQTEPWRALPSRQQPTVWAAVSSRLHTTEAVSAAVQTVGCWREGKVHYGSVCCGLIT